MRGVELMDEALRAAGAGRPVDVVVELGAGEGARTGVRTEAECAAVADAVAATATLRLVGVAGYEGEVPEADPERVRDWLLRLTGLAAAFDREGRFGPGIGEIVVSAGGSAWFDAVAEVFAEIPALSLPVLKLLRSGAYVSHDDGRYREVTPSTGSPGRVRSSRRSGSGRRSSPGPPASRPSPTRASGTPPTTWTSRRRRWSAMPARARSARRGITVTGLSDQHAWLRTEPGADLEVGDWVGMGLSHPCTAFDKWQLIPLVEADGTVVDHVRTFF